MTLNIHDDITQNFNAHNVIGTFLMTLNKNQTLRVAISKNYTFVMTLSKNLSIQHDIIKIFMYKLELTVEQTKCNIKIN